MTDSSNNPSTFEELNPTDFVEGPFTTWPTDQIRAIAKDLAGEAGELEPLSTEFMQELADQILQENALLSPEELTDEFIKRSLDKFFRDTPSLSVDLRPSELTLDDMGNVVQDVAVFQNYSKKLLEAIKNTDMESMADYYKSFPEQAAMLAKILERYYMLFDNPHKPGVLKRLGRFLTKKRLLSPEKLQLLRRRLRRLQALIFIALHVIAFIFILFHLKLIFEATWVVVWAPLFKRRPAKRDEPKTKEKEKEESRQQPLPQDLRGGSKAVDILTDSYSIFLSLKIAQLSNCLQFLQTELDGINSEVRQILDPPRFSRRCRLITKARHVIVLSKDKALVAGAKFLQLAVLLSMLSIIANGSPTAANYSRLKVNHPLMPISSNRLAVEIESVLTERTEAPPERMVPNSLSPSDVEGKPAVSEKETVSERSARIQKAIQKAKKRRTATLRDLPPEEGSSKFEEEEFEQSYSKSDVYKLRMRIRND